MTLKQDLIFKVLRFAEKHATPKKWANPKEHVCFEGQEMDEVHEHIRLCAEFGWMQIEDMSGMGKIEYAIRRLTAEGHMELHRRRGGK